jgi:hypothetical protein
VNFIDRLINFAHDQPGTLWFATTVPLVATMVAPDRICTAKDVWNLLPRAVNVKPINISEN